MPTLVFGVILVAGGLAVAISDLSGLGFAQTASVGVLAAAVAILVTALRAPRAGGSASSTLGTGQMIAAPLESEETSLQRAHGDDLETEVDS